MDSRSREAEGFAVLYKSNEDDGDGSRLRGVLEAHVRLEHARGIRQLAVVLVTALSLPVWGAAAAPSWMTEHLRTFVLAAWFVSFVGLVTAAASEWRWARRFDAAAVRRPRA